MSDVQQLGPYEIHAELGRGGMGIVYLAHDPRLGRDLAVKVLPPDLAADPNTVERFLTEARSAARLEHPNIARIFDVGESDGQTYFGMEFVSGGSLKTRLQDRPLELPEALAILSPLADAIDYAHQHQVIHRDIKPENILISLQGRPVLVDFGIARLGDSRGLTVTGMTIGTPEYMSPEQAAGQTVDWRTDLYSLAVVAYRMLCGQPPFSGESMVQVAVAHVNQAPPSPTSLRPDLPAWLDPVFAKALAKEPAGRYQTAAEFIAALASSQAAAAGPQRSGRPLAAVALAACLLLGGGLLLSGGRRTEPAPEPSPAAPAEPEPEQQEPVQEAAPEPAERRLQPVSVGASSVLENDHVRYAPKELIDGQLPEAWNANNQRHGSDGRGEWMKFDLGGEYVLRRVRLWPGHGTEEHYDSYRGKKLNLFYANNRIKAGLIELTNGYVQSFTCPDRPDWCEIVVASTTPTRKVTVRVTEAYHGDPYGDLAVAEVEFYGY